MIVSFYFVENILNSASCLHSVWENPPKNLMSLTEDQCQLYQRYMQLQSISADCASVAASCDIKLHFSSNIKQEIKFAIHLLENC